MSKIRKISSIAKSKDVLHRAFKVALIVGVILNLINQGEVLVIFAWEDVNYNKFFLTFLVPFCVSMYTAISINLNKEC